MQKATAGVVVLTVLLAGCSSDDGLPTAAAPATSTTLSVTSAAPPTSTTTTTEPPTTTTTSTTEPAADEPPWDVWTLIYASLDTDLHAREHAQTIAGDIDGGAVLLSDDYPSLNPGYWVVYAGEWRDRRVASAWCPRPVPAELSCYPRYLGPSIAGLLESGGAIAQLGEKLVVLDTATGDVVANLSDFWHAEAEFPSRFGLREGELYFGLTFEDSWFSCESDRGEIRRLDLDAGTEEVFADGWSPAISPDGRWLAIVSAANCYPDPEASEWVITPGSQVEVFDLSGDGSAPSYVMRPAEPPASYEDENQVLAVFWDHGGDGLLVALSDDTVRSIPLAPGVVLDEAPVAFETGEPFLAAVSPQRYYFTGYTGSESILITEVDRTTGEVSEMREVAGYWTGIAVNEDGQVLIGSSGLLILPSGAEVSVDGDVYNLAW